MLKRENLRKNFLRVKQMADQNFGRAEKTEVLSEDLQSVEKRVEQVKQVIQTLLKKVAASLVSASTSSDAEKRLKKLPQTSVAHTLIENSGVLGTESVMGNMFQLCGDCESTLANCALQYEIDVENKFLNPMQEILESDLPGISKCKKQLSKLTLDMDSARSRYNQAMKQTSVHGANIPAAASKVDQVREEMEESENKMMQARDNLVTEMYNFIAKESDHSKLLLTFMEAQADYHRRSLETLRKLIPKMKEVLECNPHKPVFGIPLEEHLRVTGRDIALPLEACVVTLMDTGLEEEGLFRIAGMANRVKKLKKSFDAGVVDMEEYCQDQHTVAGVLKQYFRELPEPLLCHYLFDEFINTSKLPHEQKLQALWTLLHKLPDANYNNFRYLIKFLSKLSERSEKNKMTASNIAIVIGPNLLWSEGDDGPNMISSGTISNLVELIIQHCDWFFPEVVEFGHYKSFTSHPSNSSLSDMADVSNTSATSTESVDPGAGAPRVAYQSLGGQGEDIFINRSPTGTSQSMSQSMDSNMLNSPPLAEGEQVSPQAQRRLIKKPAPPPPPNRPYSVAVSASVAKQLQTQTWQKQILNQEPIEGEEEVVEKPSRPSGPPVAEKPEKHKTVPERPEKPGKPTSSSQKYATIDRRPSIPPPGRPKIPPPSVPHHTRSASTGSTSMITKPPMVSAPTEQDWNDVFKE